MFLNKKKKLLALVETLMEMVDYIRLLDNFENEILDCKSALSAILIQLETETKIPVRTIEQLKVLQGAFDALSEDKKMINQEYFNSLTKQLKLLFEILIEEVEEKLNIAFLPYKASMWDSLATVYEAAQQDENCVARVIPIPYYQLSSNEAFLTYEGDRFPKSVPITHFDAYDFEEEQPDIIFVHNIYDEFNTITRVHEYFYTSNLKKFTEMLVYIPYHISSFVNVKNDRSYSLPTIKNVDKIIVAGEHLVKSALQSGVPKNKILSLGTPKLDSVIKVVNNEYPVPDKWKNKIEGKTVYLLNTGCLFFADKTMWKIERLLDFLHFPRYVENSVVIWRPHPLTQISIMKYTPHLWDYYIELTEKRILTEQEIYKHIIFDDSDDYFPALQVADVLISADGSLLRSYLLTEKKVLFWDAGMPINSLLPPDVFYYTFNLDEPWYELVKKFPKGYDPLAEKRKGMASKVYSNTDGTSGQKVYQAIKHNVLQNSR